jgi:hypothetical protein
LITALGGVGGAGNPAPFPPAPPFLKQWAETLAGRACPRFYIGRVLYNRIVDILYWCGFQATISETMGIPIVKVFAKPQKVLATF